MRRSISATLSALALAAVLAAPAVQAAGKTAEKASADKPAAADKAEADKPVPPPLPADAQLHQTIRLGDRTLGYTVTVGALPVRDAEGKKTAEVVYTAYVLDGPHDASRPVTFAFNGGPGASSVYLNLGAIGPRRIQFGAQGDSLSETPVARDNPGTWLDFTDLVFIDPVGTGWSRSLLKPEETDKTFFTIKGDVAYLSRIVYDWLVKSGRMASPKYVVGESYGGFRAPAIAHELQTTVGVGVSGVIMLSPALDARLAADPEASPLSWAAILPSLAAANYERQGKALTPALMAEVETYARTDYMLDLLRGVRDKDAVERLAAKVAAYTGLDPAEVRRWGGRIDSRAVLRALYRDQGRLGSWYDPNVTAPDPYPFAPDQRADDPILSAIVAPTTSAMVDFVTREVGWKAEGHYEALNSEVNRRWEKHWFTSIESASDLREALALDPRLRAAVLHGYDDLSCPYFGSKMILAQIPSMGASERLQLNVYPGGHMFYSRPDSQAALRRDMQAFYAARAGG
jgi:carboxypeptidase C (cathepsin A)